MANKNPVDVHAQLRKNVQAILDNKGWSWSKAGRAADLSGSAISAINNQTSSPYWPPLQKLADGLDVKVEDLVRGHKADAPIFISSGKKRPYSDSHHFQLSSESDHTHIGVFTRSGPHLRRS